MKSSPCELNPCSCLYIFLPQQLDMLTRHISASNRVFCLRTDASGWWQGIFNGKKALFPGNYVEKL